MQAEKLAFPLVVPGVDPQAAISKAPASAIVSDHLSAFPTFIHPLLLNPPPPERSLKAPAS
jgi:hypothetical protein